MLNKIFAYLNRNQDKLIHFLGGYLLATILPINPLFSLLIAGVAGRGKEDWDAFYPDTHTEDKWDMYCTWAGGLVGYVALVIK